MNSKLQGDPGNRKSGKLDALYQEMGIEMVEFTPVSDPVPLFGEVDTFGWERQLHTECDRCHSELWCCSVDFGDGGGHWDYCQKCWRRLSEQGALESNNWV